MEEQKKNLFVIVLVSTLIPLISLIFIFFYLNQKSKPTEIIISEIKEDLGDNNLNYIDKPSWLVNQALRILIPPLIDYNPNCYPYSQILKLIPSKDNNLMYLENKRTIIIIQESNFNTNFIRPFDIFTTFQLLNLENIATKWAYINLVENVSSTEVINNNDVKISYKTAFSLPYFPSLVIFDSKNKNIYEKEIVDYTYQDKKNLTFFPSYFGKESPKLIKNQTNLFSINYKNKNLYVIFKTYTNVEQLKKDLKKIDLLKVPPTLTSYLKIDPTEYQIITTPHKEIFFIFFNPRIPKDERIWIYSELYQELKKYNLEDYQLNTSYILPYHYASVKIELPKQTNMENKKVNKKRDFKVVITYKDKKSEMMANLFEDIVKKNLHSTAIKIDIERQAPKRELFGTYVEPPEPSLKEIITPQNYDFIITSITFLPYMNYYYIYSKDGKYNVYGISTPQIEDLLDKIMEGFSYDQKNYLEQLQIELSNQFYIAPLVIDTQCFILKKNKEYIFDFINLLPN